MTHICVVKQTTIGSDNGLSPGRRQVIILTNAGILLIGSLGTNLSQILIGIQAFSFKKMHLKMSSAKWRPFCLGLNVLTVNPVDVIRQQLHRRESWEFSLLILMLETEYFGFGVNTIPADVLSPTVARASAGTVLAVLLFQS